MLVYRLLKYCRLPRYESLYVLFDPFNLPWRAKIGISQCGQIRKGDIECSIRETKGYRVSLTSFRLPVLFARKNERIAHWIFRRWRWGGLVGTSGWSEWHWSPNILTFALAWFLLSHYDIEAAKWKAGFLLVLPLPIDFILVVAVLAVLQYAAIFSVFYGLLFFLFA